MPVKYRQPSQILTEHIRSKLFMIQFLLSNSYQKEFVIEPQPFADSHSTFFFDGFWLLKKINFYSRTEKLVVCKLFKKKS